MYEIYIKFLFRNVCFTTFFGGQRNVFILFNGTKDLFVMLLCSRIMKDKCNFANYKLINRNIK